MHSLTTVTYFRCYTVEATIARQNIFTTVAFDVFYHDSEEFLHMDGTVSIHHRNIQTFAMEMFKVKNELSPQITSDLFTQRINIHCSLRNNNHFETPFPKPVYNGTENNQILDLPSI